VNAEMKTGVLKVLIVEDSPMIVSYIEQMLAGIKKLEISGAAQDVASALFLIQEHNPDVVIIDIHLAPDAPKASGITLLATLKQMFPEIKSIMLTNLSEDIYRNTCMKMGAKYFLDKSNEFDKLPEILNRMIHENENNRA